MKKSEVIPNIIKKDGDGMNKDLRHLLLINAFYNFFFGFAQPFIAIFFNDFGTIEDVGISISLLFIIQGFTSLIVSKFISRIGSKRILLFAQLFEGLRVVCFLFVRNVYDVFTLQIAGGLIQGFIIPAYMNVYVRVCSDESSRSIGEHSSISTIAYGASTLIGGLIIGAFGYAPVFILWALQEAVYGVYIYYKV